MEQVPLGARLRVWAVQPPGLRRAGEGYSGGKRRAGRACLHPDRVMAGGTGSAHLSLAGGGWSMHGLGLTSKVLINLTLMTWGRKGTTN